MKVVIKGKEYAVTVCSPTLDGKLSVSFSELTMSDVLGIVNGIDSITFYKRDKDTNPTTYYVGEVRSLYIDRVFGVTVTMAMR